MMEPSWRHLIETLSSVLLLQITVFILITTILIFEEQKIRQDISDCGF